MCNSNIALQIADVRSYQSTIIFLQIIIINTQLWLNVFKFCLDKRIAISMRLTYDVIY